MYKRFGHPVVCYGPDDGGGTPPAGATPPAGTPPEGTPPAGATPPAAGAAPWGSDPNAEWRIADKPWYEYLPEGPTRDLAVAKAYKNPVVLADSYFSLNKMLSQNGQDIIVPKDDAAPEVINEFHKKLGRPDKPEAYEFKTPEGVQLDPNMIKLGQKVAFDLGLNPAKAQKLADAWNEFAVEQNKATHADTVKKNDTELAALQTSWGADLDSNIAAGKRAVQALGVSDALIAKIEGHIGAAPIVELMAMIGKKSSEGGIVNPGGGGGGANTNPATMAPEAAAARITTLKGDAGFIAKYTDKNHAEHAQAVDEMNQLYARAGNLAP